MNNRTTLDDRSRTAARSPTQSLTHNVGQSHSYESEGDDSTRSKAHVVFELIEDEQWNDFIEYIQATPKAARCRHRVPNSVHFNLPLHEACRRQPPLRVVNLLLDMYDEAVLLPGQYGFLPLHIACGSGASYEVVTRLLDAYPAATRCRDDTKDSLPLHLAAKWGASEEVLMEILTAHPEGSFIRDSSGKTPLDLARQLPESDAKQIAIAALETAPVLVATAKSAAQRVEREMESRIRGIQEAHNEFIRQMEQRHEEEKTEFLQLEVQFHNELATEKERNCELAELILNQRKTEFKESDQKKVHMKRLEAQHREYQERWENHQTALKAALDGKYDSPSVNNFEEGGRDRSNGRTSLEIDVASSSGDDLEHVALLVKNYRRTKEDLTKLSGDLLDREDTIISLKESLERKKKEVASLTVKLNEKVSEIHEWEERIEKLELVHRGTLQELNSAKNEMNRLSRKCDSQQQQIEEGRRKQKVQEARMVEVKDIVSLLTNNVEAWGDLDDPSVFDALSVEVSTPKKSRRRKTQSLSREPSPIITPVVVGMDKVQNVSSITQDTSYSSAWSKNNNDVEDIRNAGSNEKKDTSFEAAILEARTNSAETKPEDDVDTTSNISPL
jgi:hypothetical protein